MNNLFAQSRSHWVRYDRYEIKTGKDGKRYITPEKTAKPDVYNPLKESSEMVLEALNVGMLMMNRRSEDVVEKAKLQRPYTAEELRQPIFDFLQNVCGISSYLDLTDLRPVAADATLADVFQVPQGTPLLNMDEVDYDIEGAPVFASNEYFADGIFHHTVLRKKL